MTFKEWIKQFKDQDTPFGDLAKDIYRDDFFPYTVGYNAMYYHLSTRKAYRGALRTFWKAWMSYRSEYGTDTMYVEIGTDENPLNDVYSDFVEERELYKFLLELDNKNVTYEILTEDLTPDDEGIIFQLAIELLEKDIYLSLGEVLEEIENKNNVIPFPIQ